MSTYSNIGLVSFVRTNGDGTATIQTWKFSPEGHADMLNMFSEVFGEPEHELITVTDRDESGDATLVSFELNIKIA